MNYHERQSLYIFWQHRLCYTGITEDIYNVANRNRDQAEFEYVCGPCQHDL